MDNLNKVDVNNEESMATEQAQYVKQQKRKRMIMVGIGVALLLLILGAFVFMMSSKIRNLKNLDSK